MYVNHRLERSVGCLHSTNPFIGALCMVNKVVLIGQGHSLGSMSRIHIIFHLQISMNVRLSLLVMRMLYATTLLDPSHVHANRDTGEMEGHAIVGAYTCAYHSLIALQKMISFVCYNYIQQCCAARANLVISVKV